MQYEEFIDDTLELFKGSSIPYDTLFLKWSYKELLRKRDVRLKRIIKAQKEQEEANKELEQP